MTIDASSADKVKVFAKEHPKNPGLSIAVIARFNPRVGIAITRFIDSN
jgi:hypothetical protein